MWGGKKTEAPTRAPLPQQSRSTATPTQTAPAASIAHSAISTPSAAPNPGEVRTMAPLDSNYPTTSSSSGAMARLGASLHVKGEITGNEDLHIDGSVEGLVQLEDRKLTVGASARLTADVIAREVVVYGNVKGNLRARDRIEIRIQRLRNRNFADHPSPDRFQLFAQPHQSSPSAAGAGRRAEQHNLLPTKGLRVRFARFRPRRPVDDVLHQGGEEPVVLRRRNH